MRTFGEGADRSDTRRNHMKKNVIFFAIVCAFAAVFFLSCTSKRGGKTLYLFNWTYYTPDSVIKQFEEEFGANVWIDSYASNEEMFAKLLAGAASYDIVFPSGLRVDYDKA